MNATAQNRPIVSFSSSPTSIAYCLAGVWTQFQPQQSAPSKGSSVEAALASRPSLYGLWCAEFTPENTRPQQGAVAATPMVVRDVCVGTPFLELTSFGAPPARPFSLPANLPGSVERGASLI